VGPGFDVGWQVWGAGCAGYLVHISIGAVVVVERVDDADRPGYSKHASRFRACRRVSRLPLPLSGASQHIPCWTRYCAVARKHVGRTRELGEYSDGRYNLLLPQIRMRDWRSSSLRLSLLAPFMRCSARSLTLRLSLIFFSDLTELASLVVEAWCKKVRENQLRLCCSGDSPGYSTVRESSQSEGSGSN
jgi:hypothetical protein